MQRAEAAIAARARQTADDIVQAELRRLRNDPAGIGRTIPRASRMTVDELTAAVEAHHEKSTSGAATVFQAWDATAALLFIRDLSFPALWEASRTKS